MKNILVLSYSRNLADEWVAEHGHLHRDKHSHQWFVAGNTAELDQILHTQFVLFTNQYLEVEGYILPDFQQNFERARMLHLLLEHKRRVSNTSAETFVANVLVPNKEKLLQIQS